MRSYWVPPASSARINYLMPANARRVNTTVRMKERDGQGTPTTTTSSSASLVLGGRAYTNLTTNVGRIHERLDTLRNDYQRCVRTGWSPSASLLPPLCAHVSTSHNTYYVPVHTAVSHSPVRRLPADVNDRRLPILELDHDHGRIIRLRPLQVIDRVVDLARSLGQDTLQRRERERETERETERRVKLSKALDPRDRGSSTKH